MKPEAEETADKSSWTVKSSLTAKCLLVTKKESTTMAPTTINDTKPKGISKGARDLQKKMDEIFCSSSEDEEENDTRGMSITRKKKRNNSNTQASIMVASPLRTISRESTSSAEDTSLVSCHSSSPSSSNSNSKKRPSPLGEQSSTPFVFSVDDSTTDSVSSSSASKRVKIQQPPPTSNDLNSSLDDSLDESLTDNSLTGENKSRTDTSTPTILPQTQQKSPPIVSFSTPSESDAKPPAPANRTPSLRKDIKPTPNKPTPRRRGGLMMPLSKEDQRTQCKLIRNANDRALQKLLFNANFQFTLLPHQFIAVRKIAGLPPTFPLHQGSKVERWGNARMEQAVQGLDLPENTCSTKGFCLCDGMGLGKTVQAVAGAILANQVAAALGESKLPCIIVSPNDAVQEQWIETLDKNGVSLEKKIVHFVKGRTTPRDMQGDKFVLMTRHNLQSEIRDLFYNGEDKPKRTKSPLFPYADEDTLTALSNEYNFQQGKSQKTQRDKGETRDDTVSRIIGKAQRSITRNGKKLIFRMAIVDEAHFLKNRVTYWTIAAALVGAHAHRSIPLTGTPYNNNLGDFATMATLIDASESNALTSWWEYTVDKNDTSRLMESHENLPYLKDFILRRGKEEIQDHLPVKV